MAPEEEARFGFGFAAKSKGAMIPEPKRRRKTTAPQAPPATAGNTSKPDGGDKGQPSTMKTDKVSKASDRLDALSKFTAQALWQGSVKEKDVESKLQKSLGISAEILEASDMNEEARKTAETLEASATTISDQVDTFKILRTAVEKICERDNACHLLFKKALLVKLCKMPSDCVNAILTHVGRSLTEAWPGKRHVLGTMYSTDTENYPSCFCDL